jgi:hypothetical protein
MTVSFQDFHLFKVMSDMTDPERNHGLYTHNNQFFYMDMKRVRYDDYKYMLRVLESVIYSHRIDETNKIVVLFNNFDLVLNQYLHKFIKYADTLSASTVFIYVGTGLINFYASSTKLSGLCVVKKCYFKQLPCNNNLFVYDPQHTELVSQIADTLYYFTEGDCVKSWLVLQLCIDTGLSKCKSMIDVLNIYILPHLSIVQTITDMLLTIKTSIINGEYNISAIMNKLYIISAYPDYNVCRIISLIFKIFSYIHKHGFKPMNPLYLSNAKIIELNTLCTTYVEMDKAKPQQFNEPILILRAFIVKLIMLLYTVGCKKN